ncbi:MAG: dUTP diphosphatase [Syntrophaceae bacterium]
MTEEVRIKIIKLPGNGDMPLPRYMTARSAGMDIHAAVSGPVEIGPGERKVIETAIAIALPEGYEAQIRPRSGLAISHGITLINSPGTIDSDFRGEIKLLLVNLGTRKFIVNRGDRIAQMVIQRVARAVWDLGESLDETQRGPGGFGHTGYSGN